MAPSFLRFSVAGICDVLELYGFIVLEISGIELILKSGEAMEQTSSDNNSYHSEVPYELH
ncbi:hypothetical protein NECAME_09721 [Necator americanus]|uniref:Uncharacterized protein n=1 Tax=Necator americanus TaxID=51031 RepID=W2TDD0_NECAM|nr:hypothetical protein NECAME_09721 [Necator americanus]ETN79604.1 hypothetical protein NECAME_09721 [Necator americanus]